MRSFASIIVTSALIAGGATSQGQTSPTLRAGARVRVWATAPVMNGQRAIFLGLSADTLRVQVGNRSQFVAVPAVYRLDLNTRRGGGHKLVGLVGGLLVGGIIGYTAFRPSAAICDFQCNMRPVNAVFFGLVSGVVGAVAGAYLPPARWDRVDLAPTPTR